jgi:molybdopterin/thiamine biosynthesis adenylyltransferase
MVYYSTHNIEIKELINKFCKKINSEKIHFSICKQFL